MRTDVLINLFSFCAPSILHTFDMRNDLRTKLALDAPGIGRGGFGSGRSICCCSIYCRHPGFSVCCFLLKYPVLGLYLIDLIWASFPDYVAIHPSCLLIIYSTATSIYTSTENPALVA